MCFTCDACYIDICFAQSTQVAPVWLPFSNVTLTHLSMPASNACIVNRHCHCHRVFSPLAAPALQTVLALGLDFINSLNQLALSIAIVIVSFLLWLLLPCRWCWPWGWTSSTLWINTHCRLLLSSCLFSLGCSPCPADGAGLGVGLHQLFESTGVWWCSYWESFLFQWLAYGTRNLWQ